MMSNIATINAPWSEPENEREASRWDAERLTFFIKETPTHVIELKQFTYTWAILTTPKRDPQFYDDRWCYASFVAAYLAAEVWDVAKEPEPVGWHRHPGTGRRRTRDGDGETIAW